MKKFVVLLLLAAGSVCNAQTKTGETNNNGLLNVQFNNYNSCCGGKKTDTKAYHYRYKYITVDTQLRKEFKSYVEYQTQRDADQDQHDAGQDRRLDIIDYRLAKHDTLFIQNDQMWTAQGTFNQKVIQKFQEQQTEIDAIKPAPQQAPQQSVATNQDQYLPNVPPDNYVYHMIGRDGRYYGAMTMGQWEYIMDLAAGELYSGEQMMWGNGQWSSYSGPGQCSHHGTYQGSCPWTGHTGGDHFICHTHIGGGNNPGGGGHGGQGHVSTYFTPTGGQFNNNTTTTTSSNTGGGGFNGNTGTSTNSGGNFNNNTGNASSNFQPGGGARTRSGGGVRGTVGRNNVSSRSFGSARPGGFGGGARSFGGGGRSFGGGGHFGGGHR